MTLECIGRPKDPCRSGLGSQGQDVVLARVDDPREPSLHDHDEPVTVEDLVVGAGLVRQIEHDAAVIGSPQADAGRRVETPGGALGGFEDLPGSIGEPDHRAIVAALHWRAWDPARIVR